MSGSITPRQWLVGQEFPWPAIDRLPEGARVRACYQIGELRLARTRNDEPYLRLVLCDRSGSIEGRVWSDNDPERIASALALGMFIGVRARVEIFNGQPQLNIEDVSVLAVEAHELELFIRRSPRDPKEMEAELAAVVASIGDAPLRRLLEVLLDPGTATGRGFRTAPAAKKLHHAYLAGLLEHTLSVTRVCDALAKHYGSQVDRDLLIAGALLHDFGKIREIGTSHGFAYTEEGKLLGHIVLGIEMVRAAAAVVPELPAERLLLLLHLIASHQGKYEWQSPKRPKILEGILLHYADDLDARVHQAQNLLRAVERGWTSYDPNFARELFKHRGDASE